ncbi:hypothetical protein [Rhodococcus sp. IEGM 1379]|uniref:hypothetical protein n=1 Tax=Rhodococcus sp. IEGM 1379 TaxID=3047086 RepID=UPI0024B654CB|nr:hypothetical protein [Rhodococcus sp. IEGM 1379]MDI9918017.1 hypothetical protein [Rhodococcus sp. IEGM 1379]
MRRSARAAAVVGALAVLAVGSATAQANTPVPGTGVFEPLCTPTDPGLEELSGMVALGDRIFAIGDSGNDEVVLEMDFDCAVHKRISVPIDPYDVEDLASHGGLLILADTGDNRRARETVAFITLDPESGDGTLHRAAYPDGPHDAETVLVDPDGRLFIVTKELLGPSSVYTPEDGQTISNLAEPGPTPLARVGTVRTGDTSTSGFNSVMFTGGAVSADGSVLALRSYTDVYLYRTGDDGIGAALTESVPLRVPTPHQPQGESVMFTDDGDLVIGSEAQGGSLPPLYVMRGVVDGMTPDEVVAEGSTSTASNRVVLWGGVGVVVVALVILVGFRVRRR